MDNIIKVKDKGMRIFQMTCGSNDSGGLKYNKIRDNDGNTYNSNEWVCMIVGKKVDLFDEDDPKSKGVICQIVNNQWYWKTYVRGCHHKTIFNVLAIPIGFFDLTKAVTNNLMPSSD
jgi:hypothetical protein